MAFKSNDRTFEKVYGTFDKRDYFNAKGLAQVKIGNFERALQQNDKGAQQILDKFKGDMGKAKDYITQVITDRKKEQAFNDYKAFKAAVDSIQKGKPQYGAVDLVKSRIHNSSQKYTIALYSALRNKKFTKWKDVHNDVDSLIGESVNELNVKTYRSAVEKGLERGDDKGKEIARKAIELMGKSLSKELKDVVLTIKPLKVKDFHSSHFGTKPPMTGQYQIKFTGVGNLHRPDLNLDTKDITLFVQGELGQAKEYGGWGGPVELDRYIGWKPIRLQLSIRNGSVEVYSSRGGGGLQFTRQGARLIAKIAKDIHLSMGGDGKVKHNNIKQFTPHKNESVNEAYVVTYAKKKGEKPASAAFSLRGSALSFERDLKKDGYITMVTQKKVKGVDEASLSKLHTAAKKGSYPITIVVIQKGKVVHQETVGTPQAVPAAFNVLRKKYSSSDYRFSIEDRTGKVLHKEAMVSPRRGHEYFQLTKDAPIKYIESSFSNTNAPGVLLHNKDGYIKGKKGGYLIDYFNALFYVDLKNKFALKVYPLKDQDDLKYNSNFKEVDKAPEFSDWKKYLKESVNESDDVSKISKKAKSEKAFYDILDTMEKKYGKRGFDAWLDKSLKDLKINPRKFNTSAEKQEQLFQATLKK